MSAEIAVEDAIEYMGARARSEREDINYMLTHGEDPDEIEKCMEHARYLESVVNFLQELKAFKDGLGKCIEEQEECKCSTL